MNMESSDVHVSSRAPPRWRRTAGLVTKLVCLDVVMFRTLPFSAVSHCSILNIATGLEEGHSRRVKADLQRLNARWRDVPDPTSQIPRHHRA